MERGESNKHDPGDGHLDRLLWREFMMAHQDRHQAAWGGPRPTFYPRGIDFSGARGSIQGPIGGPVPEVVTTEAARARITNPLDAVKVAEKAMALGGGHCEIEIVAYPVGRSQFSQDRREAGSRVTKSGQFGAPIDRVAQAERNLEMAKAFRAAEERAEQANARVAREAEKHEKQAKQKAAMKASQPLHQSQTTSGMTATRKVAPSWFPETFDGQSPANMGDETEWGFKNISVGPYEPSEASSVGQLKESLGPVNMGEFESSYAFTEPPYEPPEAYSASEAYEDGDDLADNSSCVESSVEEASEETGEVGMEGEVIEYEDRDDTARSDSPSW